MAPTGGTVVHTFEGQKNMTGDGRTAGVQALYQLSTLGCCLVISIAGGLVTGLILRLPLWDSIPTEELFLDQHNFEVEEKEEVKETQSPDIQKFSEISTF